MTAVQTIEKPKEKTKTKKYATHYGRHYSIIMLPAITEVINGVAVTKPGKKIEFKDGIYETGDPAEQSFLEESEYYGVDYQEVTKEINSAFKAKSLAEKEAELKTKEDDLKRREMAIKGKEEGGELSSEAQNDSEDKSKKKEPKF